MDEPAQDLHPRPLPREVKRKELTGKERQNVVTRLLWELKDGHRNAKFAPGVLTAVAEEFHVSHHTIRRVWKRAVQNFEDPNVRQLRASPLKARNCGRKKSGTGMRYVMRSKPFHYTDDEQSEPSQQLWEFHQQHFS